jgi:transcriptional regulator with XRE-family HTH domain
MRYRNVIGSQVRRMRSARCWTQQQVAIKLQCLGWDVSREAVAEIERRNYGLHDLQLLYLADIFGVAISELYPPIRFRNRDINEVMKDRI